MRDWRLSFWLIAGSIYAVSTGLGWGRWQDLALWTRVHSSIDVATGLCMMLGGVSMILARRYVRSLIVIGAVAPALLGISLIAGTCFSTIPCTAGS